MVKVKNERRAERGARRTGRGRKWLLWAWVSVFLSERERERHVECVNECLWISRAVCVVARQNRNESENEPRGAQALSLAAITHKAAGEP